MYDCPNFYGIKVLDYISLEVAFKKIKSHRFFLVKNAYDSDLAGRANKLAQAPSRTFLQESVKTLDASI